MALPFNPNINADQRLKDSQPIIKQDFGSIDTIIGINHESFASADAGKHKLVTLTRQAADPVINLNDIAIYSKLNGGASNLFIKKGADAAYDFTGSRQDSNGWTRLPSNILLKWGTATNAVVNTTNNAPFSTGGGIPAFTSCFAVFAINNDLANNDNIAIQIGNIAPTQFQVFPRRIGAGGTATCTIKWFAIGV